MACQRLPSKLLRIWIKSIVLLRGVGHLASVYFFLEKVSVFFCTENRMQNGIVRLILHNSLARPWVKIKLPNTEKLVWGSLVNPKCHIYIIKKQPLHNLVWFPILFLTRDSRLYWQTEMYSQGPGTPSGRPASGCLVPQAPLYVIPPVLGDLVSYRSWKHPAEGHDTRVSAAGRRKQHWKPAGFHIHDKLWPGMAAMFFKCLVGREVLTRECYDRNCILGKLIWME